nr:hypothetical protein [Enterobacter bugandensis]
MSDKELSRINVIQSVVEKCMRRRDAAQQLALTERQTQRLMNRFYLLTVVVGNSCQASLSEHGVLSANATLILARL